MNTLAFRLALAFALACPNVAQSTGPEPLPRQLGCAHTLRDDASGDCLRASSVPALGKLMPLSADFNIEVGTGYINMGRTARPNARLHLEQFDDVFAMIIDQHAPGSIGLDVLLDDATQAGSIGIVGRTRDPSGTGIACAAGGISLAASGSALTGASSNVSGPRTASVLGLSYSGTRDDAGVLGTTHSFADGNGVEGVHEWTTGTGAGVLGTTRSRSADAAGTVGVVDDTVPGSYSTGVRGINRGTAGFGIGVWGSQAGYGWGVYGEVPDAGIGVYGKSGAGGFGVYSSGDFGATGVKNFVQPHPTDASKEIRFVCLEGNESGTYFRGSSRVENGRAVIEVPEDFRLVTDGDALTVQVTPLGPVLLWIESKDLDRIVVRGNEDVEFDYFVNGVRRGFAGFETIRDNTSFVPRERGVAFGEELADGVRALLMQNGTLKPDGTPDEIMALRQGWALVDRDEPVRSAVQPQLAPVDRPVRRKRR